MWPNKDYSYDKEFQRQLNKAAELLAHAERRPRALKFSTTKFYNFPLKHKKERVSNYGYMRNS